MSNARPKTPGVGPMNVQEVGDLLGVHNNTVKRIPATDLPYFRVGTRGDRRYRRGDVQAYIARRMIWG